MTQLVSQPFNSEQLQEIQKAIQSAESGNTGQIVPCIVQQSSHYEEASAKSFVLFSLIAACALIWYERSHNLWVANFSIGIPVVVTIILLGSGIIGYFGIHAVSPLKRMLLGNHRLDYATLRHAKVMFLENEVFRTTQRTGILIFISLFERKVHVLADVGFKDLIQPDEWNDVVGEIIRATKSGKMAEGIARGIEMCGDILRKHSSNTPSSSNELPDQILIGRSDR